MLISLTKLWVLMFLTKLQLLSDVSHKTLIALEVTNSTNQRMEMQQGFLGYAVRR